MCGPSQMLGMPVGGSVAAQTFPNPPPPVPLAYITSTSCGSKSRRAPTSRPPPAHPPASGSSYNSWECASKLLPVTTSAWQSIHTHTHSSDSLTQRKHEEEEEEGAAGNDWTVRCWLLLVQSSSWAPSLRCRFSPSAFNLVIYLTVFLPFRYNFLFFFLFSCLPNEYIHGYPAKVNNSPLQHGAVFVGGFFFASHSKS